MDPYRFLLVTGASGAGKTTLVSALDARQSGEYECVCADAEGVPSTDEMIRLHGSPEAWQRARLYAHVRRVAERPSDSRLVVLDGQFRPSDAFAAFEEHGVRGDVLLVECSYDARHERLLQERADASLVNDDMDRWAAYLRGQADAFGLTVLDTTDRTEAEGADALHDKIQSLLSK